MNTEEKIIEIAKKITEVWSQRERIDKAIWYAKYADEGMVPIVLVEKQALGPLKVYADDLCKLLEDSKKVIDDQVGEIIMILNRLLQQVDKETG